MGIACEQGQCRAERATLTLILTTHTPAISPAEASLGLRRAGGGGWEGRALARSLSAACARSARQTLQFQTVAHQPTTTDCQPTLNNGIQVFVTGKLAVHLAPAPLLLPLQPPTPTLTLRYPALPAPRPAPSTCGRSSFGRRLAPRRQRRHTRLASQIPGTRAAPRLRSAASASCAAQVDNSPNPLMFSQARTHATPPGHRR